MREFMRIAKALADSNRVRILLVLREGELCVCQIIEFCGLAPSTISKHLSILHQAGLVESRKTERWVYYRLPGGEASPLVRAAIDWVNLSLGQDPQALKDARQLKAILKEDPKQLCQNQRCTSKQLADAE